MSTPHDVRCGREITLRNVVVAGDVLVTVREYRAVVGAAVAAEKVGMTIAELGAALAGALLYAPQARALTRLAAYARELALAPLTCSNSNLARARTPGIRNVMPRGRSKHHRGAK